MLEHQQRCHVAMAMRIRAGREEGMIDFTQHLCELVQKKMVSKRTAYEAAPNPEALGMLLKGIKLGEDRGIIA